MNKSIAVVGAGIAGLTAAHRLKRAGFDVVVFESLDRPGGRMYSTKRGDYIVDLGTIGLLGGSPLLDELVAEAGLNDQFGIASPMVAAIIRNGAAKTIDSAHPIRDFVATDLFSLGTKLKLTRMVIDLLRNHKLFDSENAIGLGALDIETVTQYAERRLGREAADYLCSPVQRTVWMADAKTSSVVQFMWTLKQMAYPMCTLSGGNGSLPVALARGHDMRYSHAVTRIDNHDQGVTVHWEANGTAAASGSQEFDACVSALPPPIALKMESRISDVQRKFFEAISYTSMLAVHVGLKKRPANKETVLMYAECEYPDMAAVFVNHNKAPGRAPAHKGSLSAYFQQDWSKQNFDMTDDVLIKLAIERMRPFYAGLENDMEDVFVQRWPLFAMSAPVGIFRLMDDYQRSLKANPPSRLQFAGDFMPNAGINQATSSGAGAAQRLAELFR